jgi:arylsulfatase A-like enzyme
MCARLDHQFMLLLSALRKAGRYEDTAVFLFADHGDFTGDYGLVEKTQNTFEDCLTRVPFVLKPPAGTSLEPGVRDGMVELVDFAATAYDLAGIDPGYRHFGRSLLPMLEDPGAPGRDAVFCEGGRLRGETEAMERESVEHLERLEDTPYGPRIGLQISDERPWHGKAAMCRTASYKYVRRRYEGDELYDLESDPGETNNLADEPAHVATVAELRNRMLTWYMETADTVPRDTDSRG